MLEFSPHGWFVARMERSAIREQPCREQVLSRITLRSIRATGHSASAASARGTTQGRSGIRVAEKWPSIRYFGSVAIRAPGSDLPGDHPLQDDAWSVSWMSSSEPPRFGASRRRSLQARKDANG